MQLASLTRFATLLVETNSLRAVTGRCNSGTSAISETSDSRSGKHPIAWWYFCCHNPL
jgi:hypothetical protein